MSQALEAHKTIPYGLSESTLTICCGEITFLVHREVISQASAVWNTMLTGDFAEASAGSIELHGDVPKALKLALDIIYSQLTETGIGRHSPLVLKTKRNFMLSSTSINFLEFPLS